MSSAAPVAGGRAIIRPTANGGYEVERLPVETVTDDERRAFAEFAGLSRIELMRELRRYKWDAKTYKDETNALRRVVRDAPPSYAVEAMAGALKRVKALLDVPRRRNIPKAELLKALNPDRYADEK
ncbi:hypothetical protein ACQEVG_33015 [Streptomyces sp. CA-135486]|uniref:hypothetical protein n=1 Tax=Streptomyces sp. CA-135486 TaxID=3240049 RepID=UPI003D94A049